MKVIKRDGSLQDFSLDKIINAVDKAFLATDNVHIPEGVKEDLKHDLLDVYKVVYADGGEWTVEEIQDAIEFYLMREDYYAVAKAFILYRKEHEENRYDMSRIKYMLDYAMSTNNAAASSETDANANVTLKNAANLESEVYKTKNRKLQRAWMKMYLEKVFNDSELTQQYTKDLAHHIIYTHDESSSPVPKQYCMAASLYTMMVDGVGNMDGVTPGPPNDIKSFSGQITNLTFALSSQCKGAVAFGGYLIAMNYYIIAEYGPKWYDKLDVIVTNEHCLQRRTLRDMVYSGFKQFIYGVNQPAGNRGFQSPFTNISYYDHTYFESMFGEFYYPDGTKPEWKAIDTIQRLFMNFFNELRTKQIMTFPVETFAMVYDPETNDIIDQEYAELNDEMYAKGHSFFTYISDSADSLASCCRLRNQLDKNTFNPTSGLTGIKTGSCNVITLNINRIIQNCVRSYSENPENNYYNVHNQYIDKEYIKDDLIEILERVYKYHIAYKTLLYDMEDLGMFASSNGGYINIKNLYSTIGINGLNEAAMFLGLKVSNNKEYIEFLQLILGTIKEQNEKHSVHDKKRPFLFNSEVVPAEGLGPKNYKWDSEDGYWIPKDRNLYNSYFYDAHDNTSVLDKFILHGKQTYQYTDGGSAAHINLDDHLSKEQYKKLRLFAIKNGTSYFTYNIPNSKCTECGFITKHPITKCPKCGSEHIDWYTRVIGYLRPVSKFGKERQVEASKRTYSKEV